MKTCSNFVHMASWGELPVPSPLHRLCEAFPRGGRKMEQLTLDTALGIRAKEGAASVADEDDYEMPWHVGDSGDDYASPHKGPCWRSPTFRGPARR